ncbi:hypothetical protein D8L93_03635 [Sodalis-like symbiont of Bactericera trigonica]|nr:hypothetical protein D8L93_03635 [Sodalis-like symbiont of Bactericera trigonica]
MPFARTALSGHFSAAVMLKKDDYWHFAVFDSLDDSDTEPLKEAVLGQLIPKKRGRYYFFQQHNNCAVHVYNFFSRCLALKEAFFTCPELWGKLFDDYCQEAADLTQVLGEDNNTLISTMLRRYCMLESLANGYRPDEWGMVQQAMVARRAPKRGQSLLNSFRQLLGCAGYYQRLEDN